MATLQSLTVRLGIDSSPVASGVQRAVASLRRLVPAVDDVTTDAEGRLRDSRGRFAAAGRSLGSGLGRGLSSGLEHARTGLQSLIKVLAVGVPAAAASATTALAGLAAGAVAAGASVKAFQMAAQPQLDAVAEASASAEAAEKAHQTATLKTAQAQKLAAKGGDEYKQALKEAESATKAAKEADAAYQQQLDGLPPATRKYATALQDLKKDQQAWSDSLASTTMPVYTKGVQILRDLLPTLTPFVKSAAKAFSGFLDGVAKGVKSARFKEWADDMANAAGPALSNFLAIIKNLAVGFGGLLQAFLPASTGMTGGLADLTAAFADWATSLKGSDGLQVFLDLAREGSETLGTLAKAALDVFTALSPVIGVTAKLATYAAKLINALPPDVLTAIGAGWLAISVAIKAYTLYVRVAAMVTRAWAVAQGILNAVMRANPVGLIIALIVGLVAIIVIAYQRSETFRNIVQAVWSAVLAAVKGAVAGIVAAISWFGTLPGKFSDWFGQAKDWVVTHFNAAVEWLSTMPTKVAVVLAALPGVLKERALAAGTALVNATRDKLASAVSWVKGLPSRARSALGSLNGVLANAGRSLINGFINGIKSAIGGVRSTLQNLTSSLTSWKGPESLDKRILSPAGRMVIGGFQDGIRAQVPALRRQLQDLTADLPGMAMDVSPKGVMRAAVRQDQRVVIDVTGADEDMKRLIRRIVKNDGRGNVQTAFGTR